MARKFKIAALSGSLRKHSFNTATLRVMRELAEQDEGSPLEITIHTLEGVEPFNEDVEAEGWPEGVARVRRAVAPADGIIFATPEYNYSVPGVLKNAIDWLSRPPGKGPIRGLPVLIVGASQSKVGSARAQAHLRQVAFYNAMPLLAAAEVIISDAAAKFNERGELTDADTRTFLKDTLSKFAGFVEQHAVEKK